MIMKKAHIPHFYYHNLHGGTIGVTINDLGHYTKVGRWFMFIRILPDASWFFIRYDNLGPFDGDNI